MDNQCRSSRQAGRHHRPPQLFRTRVGLQFGRGQLQQRQHAGPAIISTFGLGLQGWDMSFIFTPAKLQNLRIAKAFDSVTGQLSWTRGATARDGHFTIDTPATKAVVGFAKDRMCHSAPPNSCTATATPRFT